MGRPRTYPSNADRQRAFRSRLNQQFAHVDRASLDSLHERLIRLQLAVSHAASHGDPVAASCSSSHVDTVLDRLIAFFEDCSSP